MTPQVVVVKQFNCDAKLLCVCYANDLNVFATSKSAYLAIKRGESDLFPIGFPKCDVFVYEGQDLTGKVDWTAMKPWKDCLARQ
jgi:hypothetical protein